MRPMFATLCVSLLMTSPLRSSPPPVAASPAGVSASLVTSPEDEAAARAVMAAYEDAWNRHDMHAMAALFTEDAEWVNIVGMWWRGRAAIERTHAAFHETMFRDTPMHVDDLAARRIAPDVLVAVVTVAMGTFTTPGGHVMRDTHNRLSVVLVRRGEDWRIAHGENVVIDPQAARFDPSSR